MRISISNIAWDATEQSRIVPLLHQYGIAGIEIAPTKLWPQWENITAGAVREAAEQLTPFAIPAFQSLLFDKPESLLFGSDTQREAMMHHLKMVADRAQDMGASVLVFGSPKNRHKGSLNDQDAMRIAAEFFREIGDYCAGNHVTLCIEANPAEYGCDFITRAGEAAELVYQVESKGFGLHLDTACMFLAGDNFTQLLQDHKDIIRHVHISEPYLGNFHAPQLDHQALARALGASGYNQFLSIEMLSRTNALQEVEEALAYVTAVYRMTE
jgi:D-psicose/D-tagatose/L-ribulose 3-epimerase